MKFGPFGLLCDGLESESSHANSFDLDRGRDHQGLVITCGRLTHAFIILQAVNRRLFGELFDNYANQRDEASQGACRAIDR